MIVIYSLFIAINTIFASWWVIHKNIMFHTDIARDFLLMEDIFLKKNFTLIGPRSGAIPGVFHGPLWLYLNLPAFIIGKGNPIVVGWFWVILSLVAIGITFFITKKLFGKTAGLVAASLLSSIQAKDINSLFNPYGALILSPLFLYFLSKYFNSKKYIFLIIDLFILGVIIQFQMAFGVPILILTIPLIIYYLIKNKKLSHIFSFLILVVPLSSFIFFDLRHNFLQLRSFNSYIFGSETHGKLNIDIYQTLHMRVQEMFINGFGMITSEHTWLTMIVIAALFFTIIKIVKNKKFKITNPYFLFVYFYIGFWVISLAFKGPVWSYYYWPFLPLLIIVFCGLLTQVNKIAFFAIVAAIVIIFTNNNLKNLKNYNPDFLSQDESSWLFNYNLAKNIYSYSKENFGYFIFTPDLYGYYPRYAMNFAQKEFPNIKAFPFEKKSITYLLIAPPPSYGEDPNSIWYQKNTNSSQWKVNDIKITTNPINVTKYTNGFKVEKYKLSEKEIEVQPNPYLIKDLIFR